MGGCHQRGFVCAVCLESCRELDSGHLHGTAIWNCRTRGCQQSPSVPLPGSAARKETADIHGTWQAMPVVTEQRLHASSPGGTWAAEAGRDGKQTSTAWKAREMRQQNKRTASEGQASRAAAPPALHSFSNHGSGIALLRPTLSERSAADWSVHSRSALRFLFGFGSMLGRRQRFGLFWLISQFRFAALRKNFPTQQAC